jgi:putative membrane protein
MKRALIKSAAAAVTAATMIITTVPVYADENSEDGSTYTKDESVYTVLNTDGSVKTITVSDQLHSSNGFSNYDDASTLKDTENLKSENKVETTDDGYLWNEDAADIYYQGTGTTDLPLNVSVKYELDGKEVDPKDILGKDGHLKMTISVENTMKQVYEIDGKTYNLVIPFAVAAGGMLDSDNFSNVKLNNGEISSDSSHYIVGSVMIPGLRDGLSSILDSDTMSKLDSYLYDDIVLEADVKDYSSPDIMLAAATDMDDLKNDISGTDLDSVFSQLDELQTATDELQAGVQSLSEGTSSLDDGVSALQSGSSTLTEGASSLTSGAKSLSSGASSLSAGANSLSVGAQTLSSGLSTLSGKSSALNAGANQIAQGILDTANSQLKANSSTSALEKLTLSNYADVLGKAMGLDQYRPNALKAIESLTGQNEDVTKELLYMAAIHSTGSDTASLTADIKTQAARMQSAGKVQAVLTKSAQSGITDVQTALSSTAVQSFLKEANTAMNLGQDAADITAVYTALASYLKTNVQMDDASAFKAIIYSALVYDSTSSYKLIDQMSAAISALNDANTVANEIANSKEETGETLINGVLDKTTESSEEYTELKKLETTLTGVSQFVEGLKTYTDGVDTASSGASSLVAGAQQVASGASQLSSGASQVASGAAELESGIDQLNSGIFTLKAGTDTLNSGSKTLLTAIIKYNNEGISKITKSDTVSTLKNDADLLDAIKEQGNSYNNYSGISDGTNGSVKFIYKLSAATADTKKTEKKTTETKKSFWDRIVDLFTINF